MFTFPSSPQISLTVNNKCCLSAEASAARHHEWNECCLCACHFLPAKCPTRSNMEEATWLCKLFSGEGKAVSKLSLCDAPTTKKISNETEILARKSSVACTNEIQARIQAMDKVPYCMTILFRCAQMLKQIYMLEFLFPALGYS